MKKCLGCGVTLQVDNPIAPGYVKSLEQDYCMRCFRLSHYDDLMIDMKDDIDPQMILDKIKTYQDTAVVMVVDILQLSSKINALIFKELVDMPMIVIINKLDLIPDNAYFPKVEEYIIRELKSKAKNNQILDVILTNIHDNNLNRIFYDDITDLDYQKYLFIGLANAGKSSILNKLLKKNLTASRYPGTTLDFNEMIVDDYLFVDTPGLVDNGNIMMHLYPEELKKIFPKKTFKPVVFQIWENQTYFIENFIRLDVYLKNKGSVVFYLDNAVDIHRVKTARADDYVRRNPQIFDTDFEDQELCFENLNNHDLAINGLGFISFRHVDKVVINLPKGVEVTKRKVLL